jgi:hypothetical protein
MRATPPQAIAIVNADRSRAGRMHRWCRWLRSSSAAFESRDALCVHARARTRLLRPGCEIFGAAARRVRVLVDATIAGLTMPRVASRSPHT